MSDKYSNNQIQKLSKQIGNIKDQVVDYSKNLTSISRSYNQLRDSGKKWLSSVNMQPILKMQQKSINKYGGTFLTTYNKISSTMVSLGKNISSLGFDFQSMTSNIRDIDSQLENVKQTMSTISDRKILSSMQKQYDLLLQQRNMLYDVNILQTSLDQKLKKPIQKMDMFGQKLQTAKEKAIGILDTINNLGFQIPGLNNLLSNINFTGIFDQLKKVTSQTTIGMSKAFKGMQKQGKNKFSSLFTFIKTGFVGVAKSIALTIKNIVLGVVLGIVGMFGAILMAGILKSQQLRRQMIGTQLSAGALSIGGDQSEFKNIYQSLGGQLGGQKASQIYSTMRSLKDVTLETAKTVQTMQRSFGVSASTSSGMLQNMRYIMGTTQQASNSMAKFVGNIAVALKIQPQKMMSQLANFSQDVAMYMGRNLDHLKQNLIYAKKLNMTMNDLASTAKGLDDTQKTIQTSLKIQTLTGKRLNVGQVLRLHHVGKSTQAISIMYDTYKEQILNGNRHVQELMGQMFNLDVNIIKQAANTAKKNNTSFAQALESARNLSQKGVGDQKSKAADLQTTMQLTKRNIMNTFADASLPLFEYINANIDKIGKKIQQFTPIMANLINRGLSWLQKPENVERIKSFFTSIQKSFISLGNLLIRFDKATNGKGILYGIIGVGAMTIIPILVKFVKALWDVGKALYKAGQFLVNTFGKAKSFFTGVKPGMKLNKAGRWMGYGADGKFTALKAPVSLGKRISTSLGKFGTYITKMIPSIGKLSSILKVISKFLGPIMVIWGVLSTYNNIIKRFKLSTTTSIPKLINIAIAGMLQGILKFIVGMIPFFGSKLQQKITSFFDKDLLVDSMQAVTQKVANFLLDAGKWFSNGFKRILGSLSSAIVGILTFLRINNNDMVRGLVQFSDNMLGGQGQSGYSIDSRGRVKSSPISIPSSKPVQDYWKQSEKERDKLIQKQNINERKPIELPPTNVTLMLDGKILAQQLVKQGCLQ